LSTSLGTRTQKSDYQKSDYLRVPRGGLFVFPNGITVAESNGVKVYEAKNDGGADGRKKKGQRKTPSGALNSRLLSQWGLSLQLLSLGRTGLTLSACWTQLLCCYFHYGV
jgi:hypothetical protein